MDFSLTAIGDQGLSKLWSNLKSRQALAAEVIFKRGPRVAQTLPVDPARLRAVCLPCFGSDRRCAQGGRLSHEHGRRADAPSGEPGARYTSGRQEARADDRYT